MPVYPPLDRYPDWAESSDALVSQPTPSLQSSGFTTNARPTPNTLNWVLRQLGRGYRYLAQGVNAALVGGQQEPGWRLIGGGEFSWSASTTTLAWTEQLTIAMPGAGDATNNIANSSVLIPAGSVAYVNANVPFSTTADITSGSSELANVAFESGIAVGQQVTGPGIPLGAKVISISATDATVSISANATASQAQAQVVFAGSGPLTVQVAPSDSFSPSATSVILARAVEQTSGPSTVIVGVNSGQMMLRDTERKRLLGVGFASTLRAVAGDTMPANSAVYISKGGLGDLNRSPGAAYLLDVTGLASRAAFAGLTTSAVSAGDTVEIVTTGKLPYVAGGLSTGTLYYASPTAPGAITTSAPTSAGQYVVPVGTAISASSLLLAPVATAPPSAIGSTTAFSGNVTAPGFVSAAAFKTVWYAGSVYTPQSSSGTAYAAALLAANGTGNQASSFDSEQAALPVPWAGSVVGLSAYSRGTTSGNATVNVYANAKLLFTQPVASGNGAAATSFYAKGRYALSDNDLLYCTVNFATNGPQNLAIYLWLDVPAA